MAAKKKTTNIQTTKEEIPKSKEAAKLLLEQIEKNIIFVQQQLKSLSQLRKTTVQIQSGNMKNFLNEPMTEKESSDLLDKIINTLKGLNIKLSGTENK